MLSGNAAQSAQSSAAKQLSPAEIEENLEQAESLIKKGEKLLRGAQDDLEDAHDRIRKGESLIAKGNETVRDSRNQYRALANDTGRATDPDEVADEAKQFDKLADRWEDALDDIDDGEKLIKKGNKAANKAESRINEGRSLVASGKKLRSDTERHLDELTAPSTADAANDPYAQRRTSR
tara:strand:- start:310 stop:846 length:537 start_codon:yes stop_codon:yes gene_type:complete